MKRKVLTVLALVMLSSTTWANDWPQFLGPTRTGTIKDTNFKGSLGSLKELWSIDLGSGFGGASTMGNEAFVLDRDDDDNDIIKCIDIKSGKIKWENKYKNPGRFGYPGSRSIPAISDKYVFTIGSIGDFVCTDKKTGKTVWRKSLQKDYSSKPENWGYGQSPMVYGDTVIFAPLTKNGVVSLDQATGKTVWASTEIGNKDGYASPILTTFLNQEMIIQQSSDAVVGLNPKTGKKIWGWEGYSVKWAIPAPVVVDQNTLFITGGYGAGSVMISVTNSGKVKELFRLKKTGAHIHAPIVFEKHIYANFNENDNLKKRADKQGLTCLDLKGNTKWKTGEKPNLNRGSVILINDHLIALDGDTGELILSKANSSSYKEISRKKVLTGKGKNIWSPICYTGGLLIIRDQNQMKCLKVY